MTSFAAKSVSATGIAATGVAATGVAATGLAATGLAATGLAATGLAATGVAATGMAMGARDAGVVRTPLGRFDPLHLATFGDGCTERRAPTWPQAASSCRLTRGVM